MTDLFKINERNLQELFFDTDRFQRIFDENLTRFQFDFSVSDLGSYALSTERKGHFYLTKYKSYFHKNVLSKGDSVENIAIYFMKKAKGFDFTHKKDYFYKSNSHNVLFMNKGLEMKGIYAKEIELNATSVHFSKVDFRILAERYPELFAASFLRYEKGESFYLKEEYVPTPMQLNQLLLQIENSHLMGKGSTVYADAKVLELLSRLFNTEKCQDAKQYGTKSDCDKIHEAAFILTSDIHHPPGIRSLSLQVGVNEKKLKQGFKEVFGTTPYGYLFEHKMNLAQKYLLDTDKNTSEIAILCGYEYVSHFCTAFKRKFGISPQQKRKER